MPPSSRFLFALATTGLCLSLAACSGAPNDDDLHAAFGKSVDAAMGSVGGSSSNPQVQKMIDDQRKDLMASFNQSHIIGCKSSDAGGYNCDVSFKGQVRNLRLIKDQGSWSIVQ